MLIVGIAVALMLWNKPHRKAEDEQGIPVTAQALYGAYRSDEAAANKRYLNKVVVVSGELLSREKNQDGQSVAILRGDAGDDLLAGGVMCTMREKDALIPAGTTITLKGICTGYANDVHLTDCIAQTR